MCRWQYTSHHCVKHTGHLRSEGNRSIRMQPLVAAENTCRMLPYTLALRAQHHLLCQRIHLLLLHQVHVVVDNVVLIHLHTVPQILVTGGRGKQQRAEVVRDVQACIHHLTTIGVHRGGGRQGGMILRFIIITIGEAVLNGILVIAGQVEGQTVVSFPHQAHLGTSLVRLVVTLTQMGIHQEALLPLIESSHREGQPLAGTMVVGNLNLSLPAAGGSQIDVRSLIAHRVLGVDTNDTTLGISTIERTLRSTQHVNAVQHVEMCIEGRLGNQRYVVVVDTYGRIVDT